MLLGYPGVDGFGEGGPQLESGELERPAAQRMAVVINRRLLLPGMQEDDRVGRHVRSRLTARAKAS